MNLENLQNYSLSDNSNISNIILKLIDNGINNINTCFICEVVSVDKNLVSVKPLILDKIGDVIKDGPIINNLLVVMLGNSEWQLNVPIKVGDTGIALVSQDDITTYKQTNKSGARFSNRKFNFIDSLFIPAPLKNNIDIQNEGILLQNHNKTIHITLINDNITIETNGLINIKSSGDCNINSNNCNIESTGDCNINANNATIKAGEILLDGNVELGGAGGKDILNMDAQIISPHGPCTIASAGTTKSKAK